VWIVSLACLSIGSAAATAWAQVDQAGHATTGGITVSGVGTAKCLPDVAKIEVRMQGKAEITDDALVKYQATHRRLIEALDKLKLENLRVSEQGVKLSYSGGANSQTMMNGMEGQSSTASTEISGTLRVEVTNLQNMAKEEIWKVVGKVLDAIRDAGGGSGLSRNDIMAMRFGQMPSGTNVKFVLSDLKPLREQSYERAVADARARGDRLARLNGIKLAGVTAVQETQVAGDFPEQGSSRQIFWFMDAEEEEEENEPDTIVVQSLKEIPVTVRLLVRFDIAAGTTPAAGTTTPAAGGTAPADASAKPAEVSAK
jgi:uncharacterized protein YggE